MTTAEQVKDDLEAFYRTIPNDVEILDPPIRVEEPGITGIVLATAFIDDRESPGSPTKTIVAMTEAVTYNVSSGPSSEDMEESQAVIVKGILMGRSRTSKLIDLRDEKASEYIEVAHADAASLVLQLIKEEHAKRAPKKASFLSRFKLSR